MFEDDSLPHNRLDYSMSFINSSYVCGIQGTFHLSVEMTMCLLHLKGDRFSYWSQMVAMAATLLRVAEFRSAQRVLRGEMKE